MKIAIASNFLNHHQLMLCNALKQYCDEFYFIATTPITEERLKLGYADMNYQYDFVVRTYDKSTSTKQLKEILSECDAVLFGACPDSYIDYRINKGKLSFLTTERFFKKGMWRRFYPASRRKVFNRTVKFKNNDYYVLCASAFVSFELSLLGFPSQKCYKWGYFPQVDCPDKYPERNNDKLKILWVGRMLSLKRADSALKACSYLMKAGVDFQLDFIGDGECREDLKRLGEKLKISEKISFLGSMSPENVREAMLGADIFLFTSNFREGWGAVLNESMSCGCAVLASSAVGSVPFLIEDGKNGVVYKYGSQRDFNKKLKILAENKEKRMNLGKNAVDTIKNLYSADIAAQRLVEFINSKDRECCKYTEGPMSLAKIIKNNWYRK